MKSKLAYCLLILIFISSFSCLYSKTETWVGFTVDAGHDRSSKALKELIIKSETSQFKKGDYTALNTLGPNFEVSFFPSDTFRLGLYGALQWNFIIGVDGSSNSNLFKDFKNGLRAGIALDLPFGSSMGIFTDIAFQFSWYRLAVQVIKNSKKEYDTIIYTEPAIYFDIGALAKYKNWYFKCGFNYSNAIIKENAKGFNISLFIASGYVF